MLDFHGLSFFVAELHFYLISFISIKLHIFQCLPVLSKYSEGGFHLAYLGACPIFLMFFFLALEIRFIIRFIHLDLCFLVALL